MVNYIDIVGYVGGTLGSIRLVPQIVKSLRTKSTDDLSYGMLTLSITSQVCSIIYSAHIHALPLLIPLVVSFGFTVVMMSVKYKFDNNHPVAPDHKPMEVELEAFMVSSI